MQKTPTGRLCQLNWKDVKHLYIHLHTNAAEVSMVLARLPRFYHCHAKLDKKGKLRDYATPTGPLRRIVDNLNGVLQRIVLDPSLHGGCRGRSNVSNAFAHIGTSALINADIQDFFPSVRPARVYKMFVHRLGCSPDVARILTRLSTFRGCLPQGSPSSSIVAALVTEPLVRRLRGLGSSVGGTATLFVDDATVSGPAHLVGRKDLVAKIIRQEGFVPHPKKLHAFGPGETKVVTGVRVNGRLDAPPELVESVRGELATLRADAAEGRVMSPSQLARLRGQIGYVTTLNPRRGGALRRELDRLR